MIWVAVGVVTALLVAFAVYFFLFRWRAMARHGRFALPCEEVVELPSGEYVIYYEDGERWRYSEAPRIASGFSMVVTAADGSRIELREPPSPTPVKTSGRNRIPHGLLRLSEGGSYRITAAVTEAVKEPHLTIGPGSGTG